MTNAHQSLLLSDPQVSVHTVSDIGTYGILAPRLRAKGHWPVPVHPGSKAPIPPGWNAKPSEEQINEWVRAHGNAKTGLLLGYGTVAIDIDCYDPVRSEETKALVFEVLGPTVLVRRGKKGCVLLYRTEDEIKTKKRRLLDDLGRPHKGPDGKPEQVEVLSRSEKGTGSQVVVFGPHHETGMPYTWEDRSPLEVALAEMPIINEAQIERLLDRLKSTKDGDNREDGQEAEFESILKECAFIAHCKEDAATLTEPEWYAMLGIAGRCAEGRAIVHKLSQPHAGYDRSATDAKLEHALDSAGPRTCRDIHENVGFSRCAVCPHFGGVTSPIVLGTPVSDLLRRYIYVAQQVRFFDLDTRSWLEKTAINDLYAHKMKGAAAVLLRNPRLTKVETVTHEPAAPPIISGENGTKLNLFRPSELKPIAGDASPFLQHMEYLLTDANLRDHVLDFLAFLVQKPGQKINHALVLAGGQGIGKSFIGGVMKQLLGEHNVAFVEDSILHGRFNDWMAGKMLVVIEELMAPGRIELANKLKPWITQPSVQIEAKGQPVYDTRNISNFIALTNHADPILLAEDDRRFFFYRSPAAPRDSAYYDQLFGWAKDHAGVILQLLLDRDITSFNPAKPPPITEAKRELIAMSRPALEQWLEDQIANFSSPFDCDVVSYESVQYLLPRKSPYPVTSRQFGEAMTSVGAVRPRVTQIRQSSHQGAPRTRLWIVRNHEKWVDAKEADLRGEMLKHSIP